MMRSTGTSIDELEVTPEDLVAAMTEIFRQQIAAWHAAGRIGVPVLALEDAAPARSGWCLSCGGLAPARRLRCDDCAEAAHRALTLSAGPDLVPPRPRHAGVPTDDADSARRVDWWNT